MAMLLVVQKSIQPVMLSAMVSQQGDGVIDDPISGGAFSLAFSTDFSIATANGLQFSTAFSQAFASFTFTRQFSTAFDTAFATQ